MKPLTLAAVSVLLLAASAMNVELAAGSSRPVVGRRRYDSIFSFGDSFADTGNGVVVLAARSLANPSSRPPYGMTFFGHPTGRNSNGRLIIDFIAEELGLPFVPPFLAHSSCFRQGANFAVAGATALDGSYFSDNPTVARLVRNISSSKQLEWFDSLKPSLCSSHGSGYGGVPADCKGFFHNSLFFIGELGNNDYLFAAVSGKNVSQIRRSFVPDVIATITAATERLIRQGAETMVVPGIAPLGCLPPNLKLFASSDPADYDPRTGCLKQLNDLAMHHNSQLQEALGRVRKKHSNVRVIYADFFSPVIEMVEFPHKFGFTEDVLDCCCGGGGKYNFNISAGCGMPGATVCQDPSAYLFWDGHLTEAAYRYIAKGWMRSINNCNV